MSEGITLEGPDRPALPVRRHHLSHMSGLLRDTLIDLPITRLIDERDSVEEVAIHLAQSAWRLGRKGSAVNGIHRR